MGKPQPPDYFWLAAAALTGVGVAYNLFLADDGKTLSETADGYFERWPWLRPVILTLARHVANDLHPDPIGVAFVGARTLLHRHAHKRA